MAVPALVGQVVNLLYNIVDRIYIGHLPESGGTALTGAFYYTCPTLLRWFGASDATLPYAVEYVQIYILGSAFVLTVMDMNAFVTTRGFAKISLVMALLRKVILLIPLIFILPNFFADKAFAVFLAEPVADIVAAAVTTIMFFSFFIKMLKSGKSVTNE